MDHDLYGEEEMMHKDEMHKDQNRSIDEEESMHPASLVSLKVLTGKDGVAPKVGEERVVKVEAIHGDQAEIIYAPEKPDEDHEEMDEEEELNDLNSKY